VDEVEVVRLGKAGDILLFAAQLRVLRPRRAADERSHLRALIRIQLVHGFGVSLED